VAHRVHGALVTLRGSSRAAPNPGSGSHSDTTTATEMYKDSNPGRDRLPWRTWEGQYTHDKDGTTRYDGPSGTWQTR
jgi:hypothetical protein